MTCGTCRHWASQSSQFGTCKRYPPTPLLGAQALPQMAASDWCGEFAGRAVISKPARTKAKA